MNQPIRKSKELTLKETIKKIIKSSRSNIFLLLVPVGFIVNYLTTNVILIFVMNFLAIIPSAKLLKFAAIEFSHHFGETVASLLYISFYNVVELIVTIIALVNGQIRVVQAAVLGSIFSHLLLVLGSCFFVGGIEYLIKENKLEQEFDSTAAQMSSSVMTLACISLVIPAAFSLLINGNLSNVSSDTVDKRILYMSYGTSIVLLIIYGLYLWFKLKTHKRLFEQVEHEIEEIESEEIGEQIYENNIEQNFENEENREQSLENEENGIQTSGERKNESIKKKPISIIASLSLLIIMTTIIGFLADFLIKSIEGIVESHEISRTFIGLILLPMVGHGAKFVASLKTARENKMNAAIIISVGSSTQTALFITPLLVILGWIINQPMSLAFLPFETICLFIAVILKNYLVQTWLENRLTAVNSVHRQLYAVSKSWFRGL
ncbi:17421_t:CDS:2 [Dentiscutata heterogama]|uniref:17421_t:CDS:1 n=1 Tax=Dentiscutata heterogama TaxID=1316150 RepID=A0ACA9KQE7_9GLOM|nr:17421_t:CDS:2 [Dentiscutata heterogama]